MDPADLDRMSELSPFELPSHFGRLTPLQTAERR
jgi:hypothetical protein